MRFRISSLLVFVALSALIFASFAGAQTTISTGSIVGTVTDPSGAVLTNANISIANIGTGQTIALVSNSSGAFSSGPLEPGTYRVQISAKGFNTVSANTTVQVGNTATVNAKMAVGNETTTVEVQASDIQVNTEQATVQGVLNSQQIENLPVNGRNFLDLAQLEPGVQIQDGQNFDPTKAGYSSISFGGRFGRTARIEVDGVDVSDETVGTTTQDIPASAIDEFQLSQSSLDLSQDLTSSGAVNVSTKSGTNQIHGEVFGLFRDRSVGGASTPGGGDLPFQRSQYGGNVGGAIIKDKLFYFIDAERIKQDSLAPVLFASPFNSLSGGFSVPFRDDEINTRVDYNLGKNARVFYRYNYFKNSLPSDFGLGYSVYSNKDITRTHVIGVDFNTGSFTHTIRFSYLKFQNQIVDSVVGSSLPFANTGVTLDGLGTGLYVGPSPLAPQSTPQSNHQLKYDGSKSIRNHILRYGISWNHIQGGGFADFYGTAPRISWNTTPAAIAFAADSCDPNGAGNNGVNPQTPCFPGGSANPLNYPFQNLRLGNGLGFNTEHPALGFPAGGLGPDNRIGLYIGDSWKIKPYLTISAGLRYNRDTNRTDSDLPADASINSAFPGWGNAVKQPNMNFAPQAGFAWDIFRNGRTVIRGGGGLFFENVIYNNVLFDRPLRLKTGAFNQVQYICFSATPQTIPIAGGTLTPGPGICNDPTNNNPNHWRAAGQAINDSLSLWQQYLAGNPFDLNAPNPNYIGNFIGAGLGVPLGPFAPNYKSPRSVQMNIGIQHEIRHGMVLSADYLRNIETKTLLGIDVNHVGDVKTFNKALAQTAIANTLAECGAASIDAAIAPGGCPGLHPGVTTSGATMADFASLGLTSPTDFGGACQTNAFDPISGNALGYGCAFGGINNTQGAGIFLQPVGRSVYNALQMKLVQNVANPVRGVKALNFQVAYSLSRLQSDGGAQVTGGAADNDQDFVIQAADNNNPGRYFGQSLLDRTHQISFGGYADLPAKFRIGMIAHFYSPLSSSLTVPNSGIGPGEIFRSDFTGDGTVQDPIPGTHFGQFDRGTNASGLTNLLNNYNSNVAGHATPAGQTLIGNGLMTLAELQTMGDGVAQQICSSVSTPTNCVPVVPGQQNFSWLRSFDLNLGWRYTIKERFVIEPTVAVFNLFNFSNFNLPPNTMTGLLTGSAGAINGTGKADNETFRVGNGTGVYAVGAGRQVEWGLKLTF